MVIAFNRLTRGTIVFLGMILVFDGIRTIGKIPGPGGIVYRKYELMDNSGASPARICDIDSYLGHTSVTYIVGDEDKIRTNAAAGAVAAYGSATSDVTVKMTGFNEEARSKFKRAFNDNSNTAVDSHDSKIEDKCLDYLRNVYAVEWSMFSLFMASLILMLIAYIPTQTIAFGNTPSSKKKKGGAMLYKIIALFLVFYLILKVSRFGMEMDAFGKKYTKDDKCLNQAFKEGGLNLLDNYLNLITGPHAIAAGVTKANLEIKPVEVKYDAVLHYGILDILHVVAVLVLGVFFGMFNELLMIIKPFGEDALLFTNDFRVEGDMSSMHATMLAATDEILEP